MSWLDKFFARGYITVQAAGVVFPAENTLNFATGFTVVDDSANARTSVSFGGTIASPTFTGTVTNNATLTILGGDSKSKPQVTTGNIQTSSVGAQVATLYGAAVGEVYAVDVIVGVNVASVAAATTARWKLSGLFCGTAGPAATLSGSLESDAQGGGTGLFTAPTLLGSGANIQLQVTSPDTTARTWSYEARVHRMLL